MILGHVAAEDLHGRNAQAEGEERLVHGRRNHVAQSHFGRPLQIGQQVEGQTLLAALQKDAVDGQHHNQHQQGQHHPFGDPLQTFLQSEGADQEAAQRDDGHENRQFHGVAQHGAEHPVHRTVFDSFKGAGGKLVEVIQHPACHGGVVHHQQAAADNAEPAVDMPFAVLGFQCLVRPHRTLPAGTAHRQFHRQHRHPHDDQEQQVEQHKNATAVGTGHPGELPDVANTDRTTGTDENEAEAGGKMLPLFLRFHSFPSFLTRIRPIIAHFSCHCKVYPSVL